MKSLAKSPDAAATELIEAHLNDALSEQQGQEIASRLKSDPAFRAYYIDSIGLDAAMQREFEHFTDTSVLITEHGPATNKNISYLPWIGGGAAAAALVFGLNYGLGPSLEDPQNVVIPDEATQAQVIQPEELEVLDTSESVARLLFEEKAVWSTNTGELTTGSWLKPGTYELLEGYAALEFDSGATFSINENTKFELSSSNKSKIFKGEIIASIPSYNRDFQFELPNGLITEEGNDFAVRVKEESSEIQVLAGSATMKKANKILQTITASEEAIKFDKAGKSSKVNCFAKIKKPNKRKFINAEYVHFSFDSIEQDGLVFDFGNKSPQHQGYLAKSVNQKTSQEGVFGNSMWFDGHNASVDTDYRGVEGNAARTVAFWVKIPENASRKHAYSMASWGTAKPGKKWQICWNIGKDNKAPVGALRVDLGNGFAIGKKDLRDGKWHHVAVVFAGGKTEKLNKNIKLYVDGKIDPISASRKQMVNTNVAHSRFSMGSKIKGGEHSPKTFRGHLDELYVIEAALTPHQVRNLFQKNKLPAAGKFIPSVVSD